MTDSISAVVVSRVVQILITFCRAGTALCDLTFSPITSDSGDPGPDFKLLLSHVGSLVFLPSPFNPSAFSEQVSLIES